MAWSWTIDPYVTGIGYAVQQTTDADSVGYDGTGFYSGGRSTSSGRLFFQSVIHVEIKIYKISPPQKKKKNNNNNKRTKKVI